MKHAMKIPPRLSGEGRNPEKKMKHSMKHTMKNTMKKERCTCIGTPNLHEKYAVYVNIKNVVPTKIFCACRIGT